MQVGERLSLEMDREGLEAVRSFIQQAYPDAKIKVSGTYDKVCFGGSEFLHENEWDAPYLLSQSREGDELLRATADQFS